MKIQSAEFVIDSYMVRFRGDLIILSVADPDDAIAWTQVMSVDNPVFGMGTDDGTYGCMGRKYAPSVETAVEIVRRFGTKKEPT